MLCIYALHISNVIYVSYFLNGHECDPEYHCASRGGQRTEEDIGELIHYSR